MSFDYHHVWQTGPRLNAARISVAAAATMVLAKLLAGWLTNSLAIFSDAAHSSVDLFAALVSYFAIRTAGRPPDTEHQFGHAKFESIGALVELLLLVGLGIAIVYSALDRITSHHDYIRLEPVGLALLVAAFGVDLWRTISLNVAARHTGSEALTASAMHFLSDLMTTIVVFIGIAMTALGVVNADAYAALVIAAIIALIVVKLGRRVLSSLTDRAPAGMVEHVEGLVLAVKDVIGVHDIRVRQAGSQYFTEMHVSLAPQLSLEQAHEVLDRIEDELHQRYPGMHVVTHPEPEGKE